MAESDAHEQPPESMVYNPRTLLVSRSEATTVAMPKTGSRRLVVDGVGYRWRIRRRATFSQSEYGSGTLHVSVESAEQPGSTLVVVTNHLHPADWGTKYVIPVRPSDVAGWVRAALNAGWMPLQPGPQFVYQVPPEPSDP